MHRVFEILLSFLNLIGDLYFNGKYSGNLSVYLKYNLLK